MFARAGNWRIVHWSEANWAAGQIYRKGNVHMGLQDDDEFAREDLAKHVDGRQKVEPPTSGQAQGWGQDQPVGQPQPWGPRQPWNPGPPPPHGPAPQQWYPGMPFAPYGPPPRRHDAVVRNVCVGVGALIIAVIVFVAVSVTTRVNQSARGTAAAGNSQPNNGGSQPTGTQTAPVGSPITLAGMSTGEQMSVIVTGIYPDAQAIDQYNAAPINQRLYAVVFRFENIGTTSYSDYPGNEAVLIDSKGHSYQAGYDQVMECQQFDTINVPVGGSTVGCLVYEVPDNAKITTVRLVLDSGYGPQIGKWETDKADQ
jgi:hypothetical protein